ncbi:hypothetical protein [Alteribacillus iranensis]|nr:hypothetical protein [Alteribacillus iranensis]
MEQALKAANREYKQTDQRLKKIKGDYEEALKIAEEKQQLQQEIKKLKEEEKALKHRISTLNEEKKSQEEQLKLLQQKIELNKENTIYLPAGGFTVGSDIPPGKYIVKPHGGNGNFLVNNGSKANIMLGERSESIYLEEYMLEFEKGDTIGTSLPTKYIPVISEDE